MLTRSKARQGADHSRPSSCNGPDQISILKGILKKTIGEPSEAVQHEQPRWTGPVTRSMARNNNNGYSTGNVAPMSSGAFQRELNILKQQNLQLKKGRPGGLTMASAPCISHDSIISISSRSSSRSSPPVPSTSAGPSSYAQGDTLHQQSYGHPPSDPSSSYHTQRTNILEMLVRAFPITIPDEDVCNFLESQDQSDLTTELKKYFLEKRNQHRSRFEKNVSVFKSECPWEPKWFTNAVTKLIVSTKSRPNIYQYIFDVRQREQESITLHKWKALSGLARWTIGLGALFTFLFAICLLIDSYREEGVTFSVPLILFVNIVVNKLLMNLSGDLPNDV